LDEPQEVVSTKLLTDVMNLKSERQCCEKNQMIMEDEIMFSSTSRTCGVTSWDVDPLLVKKDNIIICEFILHVKIQGHDVFDIEEVIFWI
jgi:hypothetical protein